ncbi:uncharacterized protein LOC110857660 [Folsomia candida]|nr:uncharacterized protein LOC110857660 [Folsomia candida]
MEALKIRPIVEADSDQASELIEQLSADTGEKSVVNKKELISFAFPKNNSPPLFSGIVAVDEIDQILGMVLYNSKYTAFEGEGIGIQINTFIVREAYRRKGVGFRLLRNLCQVANEKGQEISLQIRKDNVAGMKFLVKYDATNSTGQGWLHYHLSLDALQKLAKYSSNKGTNIRVRPAQVKDCENIAKMIQGLGTSYERPQMPSGDKKMEANALQRDGFEKSSPDYYAFVAEGEGGLVGYNLIYCTFHPIHGKLVHLEDLYVDGEQRGEGVGVKLFQAGAQFAVENGCHGYTLDVLDTNTKAVKFYEAFGGVNFSAGTDGVQSMKLNTHAIRKIINL